MSRTWADARALPVRGAGVRRLPWDVVTAPASSAPVTASLADRRPQVPPQRLLVELVPPRHFARESFDTYRPDPDHPSQRAALTRLRAVGHRIHRPARGGLFRRRPAGGPPAVYLDGGFGVGKTHLL